MKHSRALAIFFCLELLHFGFQLGSSVVAGYPTLADGRRRRRTHGQDCRTSGQPDRRTSPDPRKRTQESN